MQNKVMSMKQNWLKPAALKFYLLPMIALLAFGCASQRPVAAVKTESSSTDDYLVYTLNTKKTYLANWNAGTNLIIITEPVEVKTKVAIAKDGQVESAEILKSSGNPAFDQSVQQTLERVKSVQPFGADAKDAHRTFVIDFQLKPKSP
jgi:TonB family protein